MQTKRIVATAALCVIAYAAYVHEPAPSKPRDYCQDESAAFVMSQTFVKRRLKAPATAEFPWFSDPGVTVLKAGSCQFDVHAYVDAENGFGAKLRNRYFATVVYAGGAWQALEVKLD